MNIIDGQPIAASEYIDTYIEPQSFANYTKTGTWPDGTQIVKEFTATKGAALDWPEPWPDRTPRCRVIRLISA